MTDNALKNVDLTKLAEAGQRAIEKTAKIKSDPASRAFLDERRAAYERLIEQREADPPRSLLSDPTGPASRLWRPES